MILVLDNQDSFVHNLARYFRRSGSQTRVVRSDKIGAMEALELNPTAVVLSPGPYGPERAGCCVDLIQQAPSDLPILGVCLGHQAIAAAFQARIVAGTPHHGLSSEIEHDGQDLFNNCPSPMPVARYHSLVVTPDSLPDDLVVTARCQSDQTVMALRHTSRPLFGLQFHPESVLTAAGPQIIDNFVSLVQK
ncbi:MAG: aminodeoxychorismate/anthranilate synthase component II [Rhodopirellula sp. TMED11]|nr:MAG: aminodeoxychorismate/anthranilate synthase component II [Rhodopirellula sp. TMED11]